MGWRKYSGPTAFVGLPGSGKTFSLVQIARAVLEDGGEVWANFSIVVPDGATGTFHRYRDIEELIVVPAGTTVLLDEAQNMFNARAWQEFPAGFLYRLTQVRKDSVRFYYSTQHEEFVDVSLRRLTANLFYCHAVLGRLFRRSQWAPLEFRKASARALSKRFVWVDKKTAALYDTKEKVAVRLSWLRKVVELRDDPFIELEDGMTMREVMDLAESLAEFSPAVRKRLRA